jgi:hypothetical protein
MQAQSTAIMVCVAVRSLAEPGIPAARDRPLDHPQILAGKGGREEDRALQKNKTGGYTMQSNAQIDQVLRQKSDAREIPGVVANATWPKTTP